MVLAFILGTAAVTAAGLTPAQDGPKEPEPKAPFAERVTYRHWSQADGKFQADERVDARRVVKQAGAEPFAFDVARAGRTAGGVPPAGSELVDRDGVTWVVVKATPGEAADFCYVVRRPGPPAAKGTRKK